MNRLQSPSTFSSEINHQVPVSDDFVIICLWTASGLVLTALAFSLGFGAEVGQVLAVAG
jgi:hypothetical protein